MYVTMMMTDHPLDLAPPPHLNGEVPLMPHMVNGDASQQVILVQVNPGETFTIRAEDGSLQCIQGPAEVPMMSPNGSIPPIHVPPGYISQVLEDSSGVRRVVVTPQSPECYPPSYSPALSPTHHLPPYLTHPHFIPNSHSFYPPVSPGELSPHQYYQHHLPPMYGDPEIIPVYGMSNYIGREEYSKPQPKKIREQRQLERQNRLNSPPSTLYKGCLGPAHNGYSNKSHAPLLGSVGSGGGVGSPGGKKPERRLRSSPRNGEPETHAQELCCWLSRNRCGPRPLCSSILAPHHHHRRSCLSLQVNWDFSRNRWSSTFGSSIFGSTSLPSAVNSGESRCERRLLRPPCWPSEENNKGLRYSTGLLS